VLRVRTTLSCKRARCRCNYEIGRAISLVVPIVAIVMGACAPDSTPNARHDVVLPSDSNRSVPGVIRILRSLDGKRLTLSGIPQVRPSGLYVLFQKVAVRIDGVTTWPRGTGDMVTVRGIFRAVHPEPLVYEDFHFERAEIEPLGLSTQQTSMSEVAVQPAIPINPSSYEELMQYVGQRVTLVGKARNSKMGRSIDCDKVAVSVSIFGKENFWARPGVEAHLVSVSGWLWYADFTPVQSDSPPQQPSGSWFELTDPEWKLVK